MKAKHRNLYLYLALACFVGIILIFVFDGYMGVYDSLEIVSGEFPQTIEPDRWPEDERYPSYVTVNVQQGGSIAFTYEVQNRTFSAYSADLEVTVWHEQQQLAVLLSQPVQVSSFDESRLDWTLDSAEFTPAALPEDQRYDLSVRIKRGDIERNIIVYIRGYNLELPPPDVVVPRSID
jgi:hypothetical protein